MTDPQPAAAPAGWYTDPSGQPGERWWDGANWSMSTRPTPQPDPPPYQATPYQSSPYQSVAQTGYQPMQSYGATPYPAQNPYENGQYGYRGNGVREWPGDPSTGSIWMLAFYPLSGLVNSVISYVATGSFASGPLFFGLTLSSYVVFIVIAYRDSRELKSRGFPRPFGWGWAFLTGVYVIGRSIVAQIRTGRGLGPLFAWFGSWLGSGVLAVVVGLTLASQYYR